MIIGLAGYARSGKDEVAKILVKDYGYTRIAFADSIREFLYEVNPTIDTHYRLKPLVDAYGWDEVKRRGQVRELLQDTGLTARKLFGEDFWVQQALRKIKYETRIVLPDVRFKNEMSIIRQLEGKVFRVMRDGVGPVNGHVSENNLDDSYYEAHIPNNGTLEELEEYVHKFMKSYAY
jgi:hypothetical protein